MPISTEEKRAKELSAKLAEVIGLRTKEKPKATPTPKTYKYKFDYESLKTKDGKDGKDGSPDTPLQIVDKLNSLEGVLDPKVIKDFPEIAALVDMVVKALKEKRLLELKDIKGARLDMNDQRWHGGGLTTVAHDSTLTGSGTSSSPLSVVSSGGGFTYNEVVAGSGTSFTLAATPTAGTVSVFGGGQRLTPGIGNDYTISGTTITTVNSYSAGQILADYQTA